MSRTLEFLHASSQGTGLPDPISRWLKDDWKVKHITLDVLSRRKVLPDFFWLDLGEVEEPHHYLDYWTTLSTLQAKSDPSALIFISGHALSHDFHGRVLHDVFQALRPSSVEIDLAGQPDILAALEKFQALRRAKTAVHVPNADLRADSGRLSAKNIAQLFDVTLTELGEWIDRNKAALSKTPDADTIQPLLEPLAQIAFYRKALGDDASFRKWLRTGHELLEGKTPLAWIKEGRSQQVAEFVEDALTGQPT